MDTFTARDGDMGDEDAGDKHAGEGDTGDRRAPDSGRGSLAAEHRAVCFPLGSPLHVPEFPDFPG